MNNLTIVAVSDLHGNLIPADEENFWPTGEVLCITGDILPLSYQRDTVESIAWMGSKFYPWVESLPYEKVIIIAGNHDFLFENLKKTFPGRYIDAQATHDHLLMPKKLVYLEDSGYKYKGFKFYGTPWCPNLSNWAFYGDSDFLEKTFSRIPTHVDVLMSHAAPRIDTYGVCLAGTWNYLEDYGCPILAEKIVEKKPQLSIFGHIHSGNHSIQVLGDTKYVNVSLLSEDYKITYPPTVITISK